MESSHPSPGLVLSAQATLRHKFVVFVSLSLNLEHWSRAASQAIDAISACAHRICSSRCQEVHAKGMSSSSSSQSAHGQAEASSSRSNANRQPTVEDEIGEEEGLLSEDPLEHTLPEQYADAITSLTRRAG